MNLNQIVAHIVNVAEINEQTNPEMAKEADLLLQELVSVAEVNKRKKLANALISIADEAQTSGDHELEREADQMLESLVSEASELSLDSLFDQIRTEDEENCCDVEECQPNVVVQDSLELPEEVLQIELPAPEIAELSDPEPEFDTVSLEDLKEMIEGSRLKFSDRKRREVLEQISALGSEAKQYHDAKMARFEKAHKIADDNGFSIRLSDFNA